MENIANSIRPAKGKPLKINVEMDKEVDCLFCRRLFHSWFFPHTFAIVNANGCFLFL